MSDFRLRAFAVTSLALNMFLVGAASGAAFIWLRAPSTGAVPRLPLAGERLPASDRAAFRQALSAASRSARPTALDAQQARIDAASLLGQPTLDQAALNAALSRARMAEAAVRAVVEQKAVAFAATLPTDERRQLAEDLMRREAPQRPQRK